MNSAPHSLHVVYGQPPLGLVAVPAEAQPCSPLVPQAVQLEEYAPESLASAVLYPPANTIARRYVMAQALHALQVGAPLTVLATKTSGGMRLKAELEALGCSVQESVRSHHRICTTVRPAQLVGLEAALEAGGPQQHPAHGLWTQPGIFSWDRLDVGSTLLLDYLPAMRGAGADLGCGMGVLSLAVLESPDVTSLHLMDTDQRAVHAAVRNVQDARAQFVWADVLALPAPAVPLDFVVMNPPFHEAGIESKSLGQRFIERAAQWLKPGGQCWLVANRHLPYESVLQACFARVQLVHAADGFKIFQAER